MKPTLTRRQAIQTVALTAASCAGGLVSSPLLAQAPPPPPTAPTPPPGPFQLPKLPYAVDALEPHIDARTMEIHHGKHHAAYIANLNKAVAGNADLAKKTIEEIILNLERTPEAIRTTVRNNGGGHLNHLLFWQMLSPKGGSEPRGPLADAIERDLGSMGAFRSEFTKAAVMQFGSGWAWLTLDPQKKLRVEASPNQDSPLSSGRIPLLGIDVWEHAYYLNYQNRRGDYVAAFFKVIDWNFVADRYQTFAALETGRR